MPRRSIIQQYLEENDKKVGKYSQAIDAYNAENKAKTDAYNAKASDFNAFMDQVKKGQNYAVADVGLSNAFGGYDPSNSWPEGKVPVPFTAEQAAQQDAYNTYVSQKQQELNTQWEQQRSATSGESNNFEQLQPPVYNPIGDPNAPAQPQQTYVDKTSPEGQEILKNQPVGQFAIVTGKNNEAGDLKYVNTDKKGFATDAAWMVSGVDQLGAVPQQIGPMTIGDKQKWVRNGDGTATLYSAANGYWASTGQTARIAEWKEEPPAAAAMPEQPKFNTLSLREEDELKSPTLDQPGANLAAAHNMPAKTGLVNQMSSGNSVFAERDQQKNIAESGILARVLSGQIK